ncbi:TPA: hypothetical protein HA219_02340 [Candidatus Woesearchaeota archaeon]|nr:hypothetical protein [Candidatus Woesearchaeota archaeon]HIH39538.1 hypothetical protein [Candidatus Woesearchaeota archaeon]
MSQELKDLFLNWKGLELNHNIKSILNVVLIILSLMFTLISYKIQDDYLLAVSLIVLFLQILSENNKEHYLKYKWLFEKVKSGRNHKTYGDWIDFLEKTKGLNSIYKLILGKFLDKEFKKEMKKRK